MIVSMNKTSSGGVWPKVCRCGERHTKSAWLALHLVGRLSDNAGGELDLRNCKGCGSTIAVEVSALGGAGTARSA